MGGDPLSYVRARSAAAGHPLYLGAAPLGWVWARPQQAVLVLGPPRSGKTFSIVIPNVLAANGAVVTTSIKPDVLDATAAARGRVGHCWLFDPSGEVAVPQGVERLHWSPVTACRRWDPAVVAARAMVGAARPAAGMVEASHWTERAEAMLAPLLHAAALDGLDMSEVMRWVNRRAPLAPARILDRNGAGLAADALDGILATEERERSGIWSTAASVLAAYRSEAALATTAEADFDAAEFAASGDTVYVCATGRHQSLVAPLVVGLIEEVREAAYAQAATRAGAQPRSAPVLLALDEVANIAPLGDLPAIVSEGGGQGLATLACLQDLSQARHRWGAQADGFFSLFGSKVLLAGIGDVRTLEAVSLLAGDHDVRVRSYSSTPWWARNRGRARTTTWSTRRQRRLPADAVAHGRPGMALAIEGSSAPAWVELTPAFSARPWCDLSRGRVGSEAATGLETARSPSGLAGRHLPPVLGH